MSIDGRKIRSPRHADWRRSAHDFAAGVGGIDDRLQPVAAGIAEDGDAVGVKLSGSDRITKHAHSYEETLPFSPALATHAPEHIVRGTDWPHPNHKPGEVPNDGQLTDLIAEITPDARTLVDNPTKLFGF